MSLIVDVHMHAGAIGTHLSPFVHSELRKTFRQRAFNFDGADPSKEQRGLGLVEQMDQVGIDVICLMCGNYDRVMPMETRPYNIPNDYLYSIVSQAPDRIVGTGSVDPIADPWGAAKEVERCVTELGFKAIKLYPAYQQYDPRDERLYPVYKKCIELDIPIQMHMGWTPVTNAHMEYTMPWQLDEVGRRFPELKLVIAHLAYPYTDECSVLIARHENFHCDISFWGFFHPSKILRQIVDFGSINSFDRMVYGSENPFFLTYPSILASLNGLADKYGLPQIPDDAWRKIMGENACRLWKINPAEMGRAPQNRGKSA